MATQTRALKLNNGLSGTDGSKAKKNRTGYGRKLEELQHENALLKNENRNLRNLVAELLHENDQWQSVKHRFEALEKEIRTLKAQNTYLKIMLYGPKSEKGRAGPSEADDDSSGDEVPPPQEKESHRGQQRGSPGHGRYIRHEIAAEIVIHELPPEELLCPRCDKPYQLLPKVETSEELDWQVCIRRIVHHRRCYRKSCTCPDVPTFICAPSPPKLVPKGILSVGAVSHLLLEKFGMCRPLSKVLGLLRISGGLDISEGTVVGVMKKVGPLVEPLYQGIVEQVQKAEHWHADETGWKVYEETKGKNGYNWWLWVFGSRDAVVFVVDPSRSSKVVKRTSGKGAGPPKRIISSDMCRAYANIDGTVPAYCWVHVRRYFLRASLEYPKVLGLWADEWVQRIAVLYHLNGERLKMDPASIEYQHAEDRLYQHVKAMKDIAYEQINDPCLHEKGKEALQMIWSHWKGLITFLEHPDVPLDNNEAERLLRTPVVGRKNYYGSGSKWSGELAAQMFSILATVKKNGLNPLTYLSSYLKACADAGGRAPESIDRFLPWKMSEDDRDAWSRPVVSLRTT